MGSRYSAARLATIDRSTPAHILVVVYIFLAVVNSLTQTSVPRRLLVLVGVVLLGYEALGFRSMKHEQYFLYLVGSWILLAITLNGMLFGQWVQESVYVPGSIGVALALCRGHVSRQTTKVIFFTTAVYFLYRLATVGSPGAIHRILVSGSANGISELMIILCGLHYAVSHAQGARIRVFPAVLCLIVSSLTLGRSGMAASTLLLAGVAVYDLAQERNRRLLAYKIVSYSTLAIAAVVVLLPRLDLISFAFERFSAFGLGSEGRDKIWGEYGQSLATGAAALVGHGREEAFGGYTNMHSSYILWHKSMGAMAIPLYLIALLAAVRALVKDWVLFCVLAALLLRAFFDETILPFRLYDFHFYYLVCTILVTLAPGWRPAHVPRAVEA